MRVESVGLLLWMLLAPSFAYWHYGTANCPYIKKEPICGSDGITYESPCYFFKAQLSDHTLYIAYRGSCRDDENFPRTTTSPRWINSDYPFDTLPTRPKIDDHGNEDSSKPEDSDQSEDSSKPEDSYIPEDSDKPEDSYRPEETDSENNYKPEKTNPEQVEDKPEVEISDTGDATWIEDTENSAEYPYTTTSRNARTGKRHTTPRTTRTMKRHTTPRTTRTMKRHTTPRTTRTMKRTTPRTTRTVKRRTTTMQKRTTRRTPITRRRTTRKTVRRKKLAKYSGCSLCGKYNVNMNLQWNKNKNG